jgi:hypothetical protein
VVHPPLVKLHRGEPIQFADVILSTNVRLTDRLPVSRQASCSGKENDSTILYRWLEAAAVSHVGAPDWRCRGEKKMATVSDTCSRDF